MNHYGIKCGTLIDGTGRKAIKNAFLLVKNQHIVRVTEDSTTIPANLPIINASHDTVIPGLIDAHKHVMNCGGSGIGIGLNYKQFKTNLAEMTKGGVTSILDLGSANIVPHLERLVSPQTKIFNAISILTCQDGYPQEYMPKKFYKLGSVIECKTEDDIKRNVYKLYKKGVSAVKTAVVSRTFDGRKQKNWTDKALQCLTDEAHSYGLNVCAHITYAQDYEKAACCGVDSIHHAAFDKVVSEEILRLMIAKGIIFVPTLSLATLIVKGLKERWAFQPWYQPKVNQTIKTNMKLFTKAYFKAAPNEPIDDFFIKVPKSDLEKIPHIQLENVKKYLRLGGTVAMGTDSALGFSLHDTPIYEMKLLMTAGLSLEETIQAATAHSAAVFGKQNDIGTLEAKKHADIVIIDGELNDITNIGNIKSVIIDGKIVYKKEHAYERNQ